MHTLGVLLSSSASFCSRTCALQQHKEDDLTPLIQLLDHSLPVLRMSSTTGQKYLITSSSSSTSRWNVQSLYASCHGDYGQLLQRKLEGNLHGIAPSLMLHCSSSPCLAVPSRTSSSSSVAIPVSKPSGSAVTAAAGGNCPPRPPANWTQQQHEQQRQQVLHKPAPHNEPPLHRSWSWPWSLWTPAA